MDVFDAEHREPRKRAHAVMALERVPRTSARRWLALMSDPIGREIQEAVTIP